MQTRTIVDRIEIEPQTGNVAVRMLKQIVDDSGRVLASEYHRTSIAPHADPAGQMAAVNAHLDTMGYPPVPDESVEQVTAIAAGLRPTSNGLSSTR